MRLNTFGLFATHTRTEGGRKHYPTDRAKEATLRRSLFSLLAAVALLVTLAAPVAAHTQTVTPRGQDTAVIFEDPIARPWIQGHCKAAAPTVTYLASGGVVDFFPHGEVPCLGHLNPGGQTTGP